MLSQQLPLQNGQHFEMAVDATPVIRCSLCNKPFDKSSTLKRHGYYCRSQNGRSVPRSRSCMSCVKTKTRCDNGRPACARCTLKGLDCQYPAKITHSAPKRPAHSSGDEPPKPQRSQHPLMPDFFSTQSAANVNGDSNLAYGSLFTPSQDMEVLGVSYDNWNALYWPDLLPSQIGAGTSQYNASISATTMLDSEASDDLPNLQRAITVPKSQVLRMPAFAMASIFHRQHPDAGTQRVSQLMLQTLKSYPMMMLRQNTPPPFVHQQLLDSTSNDDMESWHNCVSLMHMVNGGVRGSRKLFWRNVRFECEQFCQRHLQMSEWELLAAMQALAVYVIVRLDEGDDYHDIDELLLAAVTVISTPLMAVDTTPFSSPSDKFSLDTVWKRWIMEESRRRLCVLFQIINMLVHFEPAGKCEAEGDVVLAPLPAPKQLWEASDEHAWRYRGEVESGAQAKFGLARDGQLVRLGENKTMNKEAVLSWDDSVMSTSSVRWNEWCSAMDGIGGLVMLAASLIQ